MPPNDHRAIMKWRRRIKDTDDQVVTEFCIELYAAVRNVLKADVSFDNYQSARLR
jgi:hypothetical protein